MRDDIIILTRARDYLLVSLRIPVNSKRIHLFLDCLHEVFHFVPKKMEIKKNTSCEQAWSLLNGDEPMG